MGLVIGEELMRVGVVALLVAVAGVVGVSSSPSSSAALALDMEGGASYRAMLRPLNTGVSGGEAEGEVEFRVDGDDLTIVVVVRGASPGIEHWQHIHGFRDDRVAACPGVGADTNGDGIIDLMETEPVSGITMVPFNSDPVALDIPDNTYPRAGADGSYRYEKRVSRRALESAFRAEYGGELDLHRRVVYIHGVPSDTPLPATVESLGSIPAQVTLPIACGRINRVVR